MKIPQVHCNKLDKTKKQQLVARHIKELRFFWAIRFPWILSKLEPNSPLLLLFFFLFCCWTTIFRDLKNDVVGGEVAIESRIWRNFHPVTSFSALSRGEVTKARFCCRCWPPWLFMRFNCAISSSDNFATAKSFGNTLLVVAATADVFEVFNVFSISTFLVTTSVSYTHLTLPTKA